MTQKQPAWRHWRLTRDDEGIAWLTLDVQGAGANVLSREVLAELEAVLEAVEAEPPRGLVIRSGKPNGFIAGADVREFTRLGSEDEALTLVRRGQALMDRLEALPCPTVALIHGFCVGGGLELALACRWRVAEDDPRTRLGLPEVRLGIHPGFGGTARGIALLGPLPALDLMLTGRTVDARQARRLGLVDHAVPRRHLETAVRRLVAERPPRRQPPRLQRALTLPGPRHAAAWLLERRLSRHARRAHYPAPYALIGLWRRHGGGDARAMIEAEARSVARLIATTTARNLVRVFLLGERLKGFGKGEAPPVRHVHVIGAGTMGGDIAAWCALRGLAVTLTDTRLEALGSAVARAAKLFRRRLRDPRRVTAALDRLTPDPAGAGARRADVVIEAIVEDLEAKRALFARVERDAPAHALLATNTSSIPLEEIAAALEAPERLVGLHFFNPVAKMRLVEVVTGESTGETAARRACAFVRGIDRLPLPVRSAPGFLVNRALMPYLLEAVALEAEGVHPAHIDEAALAFGMPMGPIELADTVGLDVCLAVAEVLGAHLGRSVPERLRALVQDGRLGRKSGQGFYAWREGSPRRPRPPRDAHPPQDLTQRLIYPLLNELVACLREGVVSDPDLADAGLVYGAGFAPFRGGPMHYALDEGPERIRAVLETLARRHGERFRPDPGWETVLATGRPAPGGKEDAPCPQPAPQARPPINPT